MTSMFAVLQITPSVQLYRLTLFLSVGFGLRGCPVCSAKQLQADHSWQVLAIESRALLSKDT